MALAIELIEKMDLVEEVEVAQMYGVTVRTLRNWAALGKGPRVARINGSSYYKRAAVEADILSRFDTVA